MYPSIVPQRQLIRVLFGACGPTELRMDFTSQLANLERAASRGGDGGDAHDHHPHRHNKRPRHSNEDRSPQQHRRRRHYYFQEHAMQKALVTLPRYRAHPSSPNTDAPNNNKTRPRHIALLFITIDDLPYEEIWKAWATQASNSDDDNVMVSVVCHAKFPNSVKSSWLKQRLLVEPPKMGRGREFESPKYHTRRPAWGSIEITRAMLDVLHESLQIGTAVPPIRDERFSTRRFLVTTTTTSCDDKDIPPVDKFIFVSETCLPVSTLQEVKTALFCTNGQLIDESWVNASSVPNNGYARQLQFEKVDPVVPKQCVYKADQWMVLSRGHAVAVMELDRHLPRGASLWQCFVETKASDELYFPTALALLGIVPSSPQVLRKRVTYADWSVSARNPASFTKGLQDLKQVAASARLEGCLFARKFSPFDDKPGARQDDPTGCITVDEWKECIEPLARVQSSSAPEHTKRERQVAGATGTVAQYPTVEESQTGRGEEES